MPAFIVFQFWPVGRLDFCLDGAVASVAEVKEGVSEGALTGGFVICQHSVAGIASHRENSHIAVILPSQ